MQRSRERPCVHLPGVDTLVPTPRRLARAHCVYGGTALILCVCFRNQPCSQGAEPLPTVLLHGTGGL